MGYFDPDVYYQPEAFGLTVVGEVSWSEPNYDFELTAVWVDGEGRLYWADDSGCSCPAPFESYTSLDMLGTGSLAALTVHLDDMYSSYHVDDYVSPQIADVLTRAREATRVAA